MALTRDHPDLLTVEEEIGGLLAMPAGDHGHIGPQGMHGPDQIMSRDLLPRPGQHARLREVGGDHRRARNEL